jgi:hypothetical protein
MKFDVRFREFQAEHLFYQLWGYYGDEVFFRWIEAEGYTVVKRAAENQGMVAEQQTTGKVPA